MERPGPGSPLVERHDSRGLLERVVSADTLARAWERVKAGSGAPGGDGVSLKDFGYDPPANLGRIATAVRSGSYEPGRVRTATIPKHGANSGERRITILSVSDRVLQRAFLDVVSRQLDERMLPSSHAYRSGHSAKKAVELVRRSVATHPFVADADIKSYFDSVSHESLIGELEVFIHEPGALGLIRQWLAMPNASSTPGCGIPLGAPLSPFLANIYLHRLDAALWRPDQVYARYADNLCVMCRTQRASELALETMRDILALLGLSLNEAKTSLIDTSASSFVFLGCLVKREPKRAEATRENPATRTLFLTDPDASVRKRGEVLVVERSGDVVVEAPFARIREIHVLGNVQITTQVITECLTRDLPVIFTSSRGRYRGRLEASPGASAELRLRQVEAALDPARSLAIARPLISGKIANQRRLLQRHAAKPGNDRAKDALQASSRLRDQAERATSLATLRSVEGQASRVLFQCLASLLAVDLGFTTRKRRPPPDPVNAMLSFGYTLLAHEATSAACAVGLDPYVGFLHLPRHSRPSIALDLMEEFRPVIVDALVIGLVNKRVIGAKDFHREPDGACLLLDEPRRVFLREYEERMLTLFTYEPTGERLSYRAALLAQARQIARVVREHDTVYVPVRLR